MQFVDLYIDLTALGAGTKTEKEKSSFCVNFFPVPGHWGHFATFPLKSWWSNTLMMSHTDIFINFPGLGRSVSRVLFKKKILEATITAHSIPVHYSGYPILLSMGMFLFGSSRKCLSVELQWHTQEIPHHRTFPLLFPEGKCAEPLRNQHNQVLLQVGCCCWIW